MTSYNRSLGTVVLEVIGLKTWFFTRWGIIKAVDGVNFSLREGETIGFVGESGCGKTICSRSILRLLPTGARIVAGQILFRGQDLLAISEKEMTKIRGEQISMIFQDPNTSLNPLFSIGNQVSESLRIHKKKSRREAFLEVMQILRKVKIPSIEIRVKQYPHQMSGGMKQRVVGGIAVSCDPLVLIADEPTTSLDLTTQDQYLDLLEEIQMTSKMGLIFITHDLSITARMCNYIHIFYGGKILESAPINDIFYAPVHPYTVALMKCLPRWERDVERLDPIRGEPPRLIDPPELCRFLERCNVSSKQCYKKYPPQVKVSEDHHVTCWNVE